ncbi:MAG: penicillin-binding protein activator [Micavibrio sp.]|nr:penicillin-binding protein activator [Micavibrio sp.]
MLTIKNLGLVKFITLFGLFFAIAGCSVSAPKQRTASKTPQTVGIEDQQAKALPPAKVAILLPLSGTNQSLGQAMLNAAQIALFDVGYSEFELIPRDTKGTEIGARMAAQAAVNDGAQLIIGPIFAHSVKAVKPIAAQADINMLSFSTDWTLVGQNNFTMGFLPFDQITRVSAYAASKNVRRIGILYPQNSYGRASAQHLTSLAPKLGLQIAASMPYPTQSHNLAPTIYNFVKRGPFDAVFLAAGGQDVHAISNLLSLNGMPPHKVRRLGTGLLDDLALAGEVNLEGALFAAPDPMKRKEFENKYYGLYSQSPPRLTTLAYDATALAVSLARRADQNERYIFKREALLNPNGFSGIDGIFRFRGNGTSDRRLSILTISNRQIKVIEPAPTTFARKNASTLEKTNTTQRSKMAAPSAYRY